MTHSEASALSAKLFAAFPQSGRGELTKEVYVEQMEKLQDAQIAAKIVDRLIENEVFFPVIAVVRAAYMAEVKRAQLPALNPPPLTDAERAEGLKIAREFLSKLGGMKEAPQ